jgi:hypothetical protein
MNNLKDFQPLIEGKKVTQAKKLTKHKSFNSEELKSLNNSFRFDKKALPTCFPIARRLSIKNNLTKKTCSDQKIIKNTFGYINLFEDTPLLQKKTFHNERIYWKKRGNGVMPLLLINFEGVAGDYFKVAMWKDEKASFMIRENFFSSIARLKQEFYIALISTYSRHITNELLKTLDKRGNSFDAIYLLRHRKWHARYVHDINSILEDFKVLDRSTTIAISAIGLDSSEIREREGKSLIYERTLSKNKRFLCYFAPTCDKEIPVTVLVPHIRLFSRNTYFNCIAEFILKIKSIDSNFFSVFDKYSYKKIKTTMQVDDDKPGPVHKFIFFVNDCLIQFKPSSSEYQIRTRKQKFQLMKLINK